MSHGLSDFGSIHKILNPSKGSEGKMIRSITRGLASRKGTF
jgi:hypothetical protein